ncbi:hypothetical protein HMPREF3225_00531, partial [Staphylococcus lugdunensis]
VVFMARLLREQDKLKTEAPTDRLSKRKPTDKAIWSGAPNTKKCNKHFREQRKLGWGPNKEKCEKHFVDQSKLGWLRRHPRKAKPLSIVNKIASK